MTYQDDLQDEKKSTKYEDNTGSLILKITCNNKTTRQGDIYEFKMTHATSKRFMQNPTRDQLTSTAKKMSQMVMVCDKFHFKNHKDMCSKTNCSPNTCAILQDMKHLLYLMGLVQLKVKAQTEQCPSSESQWSIPGWMLQRHIYKTMPSDLSLRCLVRCQTDDRCQSFNFVLSRHMCEFSDRTKEASPKDFIPDPDRFYLTRMKDRAPIGSTPLLAAISCKEIKASEGEAVSGKYWLSGLKPNVMVFAFCNMKTGDVNECNSSPSLCDVNAQCINTTCSCKPGFFGDGKSCQKIAFGRSCKDIKTTHPSLGDDLYWLEPDGGNQSNAFLAYCDMTSYNGGWTMCYTTDEYAKPKSEVTYNPDFPYGVDGYRTNCNNISFTEIMFIDHQTGSKVYFKRKSNHSVKAAANYGNSASALGLWDAVGANRSYSYQLLICDTFFYSGFMVSGFTGNCYKQCNHWCGDSRSPYFRTATTSSGHAQWRGLQRQRSPSSQQQAHERWITLI